ncbi:RHAG protein, partial [Acromyrmex heyeri]
MYTSVTEKQQVLMLFLLEIILIALIGTFMSYGPDANANLLKNRTVYIFLCDQLNLNPYALKRNESIFMKYENTNNFVKVTTTHIYRMTLRTLRWLHRHIVNPCTMLIRMRMCNGPVHAIILLFIEGFLLCAFLAIYDYAPEADASNRLNSVHPYLNGQSKSLPTTYTLYQDVHVMIWIGFGFLMTFLKKYSQSAVGLTFLVGAILVQVALICDGVMNMQLGHKAYLSLESLLSADVAVATPLISMGAILGKVTYMQLVFMGIVELIMFTINKYVGEKLFMVNNYSLPLGTVFLWLFWPSFNSAALTGDDQQRAIINTLLSISASCVITFAVSALVSKDNKFNMVHVQNSTLAGGVAIGTAAG